VILRRVSEHSPLPADPVPLGQNGGTRRKPPSSDSPFAQPAPKSLLEGQPEAGRPQGPSGSTLAQVDDLDEMLRQEQRKYAQVGACRQERECLLAGWIGHR
jgi:hypothetical protein